MTPQQPYGQPVWVPPQWQQPAVSGPIGRRWLVLVIVGGAALVTGIVLFATAILGALSEPVLSGAGSVQEKVNAGTYYLYAQTGTSHSFGPVNTFETYPPQVYADATHVSLDGVPLTVDPYNHGYRSTLTLGSRTFSAVAEVQVPHDGSLTLAADRDEGSLVVAPSVGETFKKLVVPGILALTGLVVAGVGVTIRVRAGSKRKPRWMQGYWAPPQTR